MTEYVVAALFALIVFTAGAVTGTVFCQARQPHRLYERCIEHHPVAACREVRP